MINISPAALEAGAKELCASNGWPDSYRASCKAVVEAVFVAMVEAWEGAERVKGYWTHDSDHYEPAIILPLMEKRDDE